MEWIKCIYHPQFNLPQLLEIRRPVLQRSPPFRISQERHAELVLESGRLLERGKVCTVPHVRILSFKSIVDQRKDTWTRDENTVMQEYVTHAS